MAAGEGRGGPGPVRRGAARVLVGGSGEVGGGGGGGGEGLETTGFVGWRNGKGVLG